MPMLMRRRVILAKIETTYGTDSSPTGSANAILVRNLTINPISSQVVSRDLVRPYLGASTQLIAERHVEVDFEVEVAGAGTAGAVPAYGPLLRACALSQTVAAGASVGYAPISTGFESVTIYYNGDGVQHKLTGCRGTVEFSFVAGQIPVMKFKMVGLYNAPADVTLPTVDYTAFQTPVAVNTQNTSAFQFFSYAGILQSLTLNMTNTVNYRTLIGNEYVQITDRKVEGTAVFEAPTIGTKDFFTTAIGTALGNLTLTHGTTAGNKFQLASSNVDITQPTYTDDNGVIMLSVPFVAIPSSAGNDEVSFTVL